MFQRLRAFIWQMSAYRLGVLIGLAFTIFLIRKNGHLNDVPVIGRIENIFHDLKFRERGIRPPHGDVVIGAVDEKAIAVLRRWPFDRADTGVLVDKITALGAKAIVFDVAYIDKVAEGEFAGAKRLQAQFSQMSFASDEATDMLAKLSSAKTDASGAIEAAKALPDSGSTARDVRTRLEPIAQSLEQALHTLEKYKTLDSDFSKALEAQAGGVNGDAVLAASVHRSGRVVLGSFLMTPSEFKDVPAAQEEKELKSIAHVAIPFPTTDPAEVDNNPELINEGQPIYGVQFRNFPGARAPFEALIAPDPVGKFPATQVSFFNTAPDPDGVIRREPLILAVGDPALPDKLLLVPNIDLGGILKFEDADPSWVRPWVVGSRTALEYVALLPGSAKGVDGPPKKKDFMRIPVDPQGHLLLNYYGPDKTFPNISLGDIWNGDVPKSAIDGKIVLIGATATGTYDQRVTPYDPLSPGVEIHATAMENILHKEYLLRPWWATAAESAILLGIALIGGLLFSQVKAKWGIVWVLALAGAYHLFDYLLFLNSRAIFSAYPLAEMLTIFVAQTVYRYNTEEAEKRQIRRAFQFYLNKSVIEEMLKDPSKLKLGGDKRVLTVMFSDIRGFTTISEKLTPEQLAKLMNEYLTPMTNLVLDHGGTLDKYIGDAVMAIFGAPLQQDDHALRCCKTAVAMIRELAKLQERWRLEGYNYPPIDIGLGINSGPMVVGNMGADQRFSYTVLGDNVNLASRLEGTNKEYRSHIIISGATFDMCGDQIAARQLGAVRVKGKLEPVLIYELLDDKPPAGELAQVIGHFNKGIGFFRTQKWDEARAEFNAVLGIWPGDGPAEAYLDFTDEYEKTPPGADWDGVYVMTHK